MSSRNRACVTGWLDGIIASKYIALEGGDDDIMNCVFVQLRCMPGRTYDVADKIYEREIVSELYSTSGDYDLLAKIYVPEDEDIGKFVNDRILDIDGIARSLTTLTFQAF